MSGMTGRERAAAAREWWRAMQPDRGGVAALSRASSVVEVAMAPRAAILHLALFNGSPSQDLMLASSLVAGVLSNVRADAAGRGFATALGLPADGRGGPDAEPLFKPVRAGRLRAATAHDEAMNQFRGAVALLNRTADVADLARYLLEWCDDRPSPYGHLSRAEQARLRFANAYHSARYGRTDKEDAA